MPDEVGEIIGSVFHVIFDQDKGFTDLGSGIKREFSGRVLDQTIKVVCGTCNNGWMSLLQSRAMPLLLPMIQDKAYALTAEAQQILAAWAVMFSIIAERRGAIRPLAEDGCIPMTERRHFKDTQKPSGNWFVWIGRYRGTALRQSLEIGSMPIEFRNKSRFHVVQTTFVVGSCVFQTFLTNQRELRPEHMLQGFTRYLLPLAHWSVSILRPPAIVLNDAGVKFVQSSLITTLMRQLEATRMKCLE